MTINYMAVVTMHRMIHLRSAAHMPRRMKQRALLHQQQQKHA